MKTLNLPSQDITYARDNLFGRTVRIPTPSTLIIKNGVGQILDYPGNTLLLDADFYFLGGHNHTLSDDENAAITAAGFGDLIVDVP
jgi:hypothetical protein